MKIKLCTLCLLLVSIYAKTFAQINWQPTNGPEGGSFLNIYDDGQYAFAADEYQFFRTSDGLHWEHLPHGNIWPLATSPTKLAAGKGYGYNNDPSSSPTFVVSYDHGNTWKEGTMPPTTYGNFSSIAVCSHGVYVPDGSNGKIFRTQDDGLTWDAIPVPGMYCYDVWAFDDRLYTEWNRRFWRLGLNGTDWEIVSPLFGSGDYASNMYASDSLLFFATKYSLWCSSNAGGTWSQSPLVFHSNQDKFCKIGNRVYTGGGQSGVVYTDDFGYSWQELPIQNDFSTFDVATAGGQLLCGSSNKGVFRYDMPNQQLVPSNEGLNSATVHSLAAGNGQLWAACGNGVFAYDLAQDIWVDKALLSKPYNYFERVAVSPAGKIIAHDKYPYHFYLSVNGGASWDTISTIDIGNGTHINIYNMYWVEENILLKSESDNYAWSADLGQSWKYGEFPDNIVFFAGRYFGIKWSEGLVSSNNSGHSWKLEAGPKGLDIIKLYASDDKLFALIYDVQGRTKLYSTSDLITWTYSGDGLPQINAPDPNQDPYYGGIWHKGNRYYLHETPIGLFTSLDTCKTWLPIERYSGSVMEAVESTLYQGGFGGGVLKTGLPQNYGALSTGHVYQDDNNNSIWDANEAALPSVSVSVKEPGAWYPYWFVNTESDGNYSIGSSPGNIDTLQVSIPSVYVENINPPQYIVTNAGNNRDFGIHSKRDITDVSIEGYYGAQPRPGFSLNAYIGYHNEGTVPASGKIGIKLDPKYNFVSADPLPTAMVGTDSLIWDFDSIPPFSQQQIRISGVVDVSTVIGNPFKLKGHIEPTLSDFKPSNNHFVRIEIVVGSFDPNEKRVEPAQGLTPTEIAAGKELVYTVHFQNTGTYQADRVRITDMLDTALNVQTLRLIASSHAITSFRLLPGNLLEVVFDQIALPDSNSNEPASHGFVSFAIQRNKAFNKTRKVLNTAAIYFDFNEPIITNTVITPVATPTVSSFEPNTTDTKFAGLVITPNPTAKDFVVDTRGRLSGTGNMELFNAQGKICLSIPVTDLSSPINVAITGLTEGAYMVRATGKNGVLFGKVVVVR